MRGNKVGRKILVVEDDEANYMLSKKILNFLGYEVEIVKRGGEALDFCQREQVDLILMDISLPDIDGVETTKKIREIENYRGIPIIPVTAYDVEHEAFKAGFTDYLQKPFQIDGFTELIQKHLEQR